ncbi:2'-5'-oligoadenylate synthase 1-like [Pipistrellus kuhlii]|uniref:2'-5'-oligoadenylate synthase 1-like n=1 Tax=Pipistrellus kuhlii TaxID=59472 RepID=UPI00174F17E4|nr:2'-5'-oligoadenylate synthase 1-like [Pipistrellus kuhlii]
MSLETLETTPARDLDRFIERHLLPDTDFRTQIKGAIDIICSFLKERCFQGQGQVQISKVVKAGSLGKGTALRDTSDADLVVFLSPLTSFQEQFRRREEFIREIRRQLEACQRERRFAVNFEVRNPGVRNPRALGFTLKSPSLPGAVVEFDVLPAHDVLGQVTEHYRPSPNIYVKLIEECKILKKEGEFSACFTELQRAFLKQRPAKLKSLVRLVKHWYQKCKEKVVGRLPPKYALELLTIYAWERAGQPEDFNTAQGFRKVLALVMRHRRLCIYWTQYYDSSHPVIGPYLERQFRKPRPVILDPADPTNNVGGQHRKGWKLLAREAGAWLMYQCFHNGNGSPVRPWNLQD